jgi:putative aminopeptidase FrvX
MAHDVRLFLGELLQLPGVSAYESSVRERIRREWEPLVAEIADSPMGELQALKQGVGPSPRNSVMLAAHMDSIGLMVNGIQGDFLRVQSVGGIDPRVLPGCIVKVHGGRELIGEVFQPPKSCLPEKAQKGAPDLRYLLVDVGLPEAELRAAVEVGDLVTFASPVMDIGTGMLAGPSLDDRASVAALTLCLHELQGRPHAWDLIAVATTQEEVTAVGALHAAYSRRPSLAIAVDVTFGQAPDVPEHQAFPIGEGLTNGWGPNVHPAIFDALQKIADQEGIPITTEVMPGESGTDAELMQTAAGGIPTGVLSIPLRYMHTPVELVSMGEIEAAGKLLAAFVLHLEDDFVQKLSEVHIHGH